MRGLIRRTSAFFRRRRLAFAMVLGALVLTDFLVAVTWPGAYRATATVTVEPARLPEDVKPLVPSVQERIGRLEGLALSDQHLAEIARSAPRLAHSRMLRVIDGAASSPVQAVREAISIDTRGRGDRAELIVIAVTGERAEEAAFVASAVASRLVKLDRDFRLETAAAIHSSVLAEATADERPADELRARIDRLRAENPLMATSSDAAIRAQLDQESRSLDEDQIAQVELAASLPLLDGEVARWSIAVQEEAAVARRTAAAAEAAKNAPAAKPADDPRRARLVELEKQLVQARSHWTEQNPEVKRLIREIALEREYLGEPDPDSDEPPPPRGDEHGSAPRSEERPDGVRTVADTQSTDSRFLIEAPAYRNWRESVAKLEAAKSRKAALEARIQRRSADIARLRAVVDTLPAKRLELARLEGERDRLIARAKDGRERLARVEEAWRIEQGDARTGPCTERLAATGAVHTPEFEVGPDRLEMFLLGLLIAFPIAALAAYVRDAQDRSLHSDEEVSRALDLPVLGVIPRLRGRR